MEVGLGLIDPNPLIETSLPKLPYFTLQDDGIEPVPNENGGGAGLQSSDAAIFMNVMPTEKPYSNCYGVTLSENAQLAEDQDEIDNDDTIYWTVHPPSAEEAANYQLPCSASDRIQLSSKANLHLMYEQDPYYFLEIVITDEIVDG